MATFRGFVSQAWDGIKPVILPLVVICLFALRPPLGTDTYYFFTQHFEALPLAALVFHHISLRSAPILCAVITWLVVLVLIYQDNLLSRRCIYVPKIDSRILVALPYLFIYTFRVEDDQLAFPLLVVSELTYAILRRKGNHHRAYLLAAIAALPALLIWRGTYLYLGVLFFAFTVNTIPIPPNIKRIGAVIGGIAIGALFTWGIHSPVAEANPLFSVFFAPIILLTYMQKGAKSDYLMLMLTAAGILYPKLLWTALPLYYYYAARTFERFSEDTKRTLTIAGLSAVVLAVVTMFPQPWLNPTTICPHQSPQQWYLGWWCEAHGFSVKYAGAPPSGGGALLDKVLPNGYNLPFVTGLLDKLHT